MSSKKIKKFTNAFTVDVEDYFHVSAFAKNISPDDWGDKEQRVVNSTNLILSILDDHNIVGTFFILGWVAERFPELVRTIADCGHEIACHGMSHQLIYNQSQTVFREETARSKHILEDIVQTEVNGYRAASYSITRRSTWALEILVELGFKYDSSIFPVVHDRYGIPGTPRTPYNIDTPAGVITEFPLSTVEFGKTRLPISGGGYFRLIPYQITRAAFNRINNRDKQPFIFYLHPWEVDENQPRIQSSRLSMFRHYTNLKKTQPRLRQLLTEFEFSSVQNVLDQYELSNENIKECAVGTL